MWLGETCLNRQAVQLPKQAKHGKISHQSEDGDRRETLLYFLPKMDRFLNLPLSVCGG